MQEPVFTYDVFLSHSAKDRTRNADRMNRIYRILNVSGIVFLSCPVNPVLKPNMQEPVFNYDVFLSHSAKDKALVRPLAERLPLDFGFRISDFGIAKPGPFRFRDPLNKERRFIPLQLDDAPIKGVLTR
jgi:hypothetical protein